jgi:hypothetical protein
MDKIPFCIECAFRLNVENNPGVIVMSRNGLKPVTMCYGCYEWIGHSKALNKLIGVYHEDRHAKSKIPHPDASIRSRFNLCMQNKFNGDTLDCFKIAIKNKKYSEEMVREYFNELVSDEDMEMYKNDKKKLINELMDITGAKTPF